MCGDQSNGGLYGKPDESFVNKRAMAEEEEDVYSWMGGFGRWQMLVFGVFFYANMVGAWQNYAMTFLAPNVPFRCVQPSHSNETGWPGQCAIRLENESVPCTRWEYDSANFSDTLVSEFDLVCDREWLISFSKSVYMIGQMASSFVFGQVSDCIGRLPTLGICFTITCVGMVASPFATSFPVFLALRFLQAFGRTGFSATGFILLMEIVGPRRRTLVAVMVQLGFTCGLLLMAAIGYFFKHWFWIQVAIALPLLPLAASFFFLPESIRWLLIRQKFDRLKRLIVVAARWNGKCLKENPEELAKKLAKMSNKEEKGSVIDLFRTPKIRWRTLTMMYIWLVIVFLYYALSLNTNDLSGDPHLNFLINGALEIPSFGVIYLSVGRFGRRPTSVALMLLGGMSCLALVAVPQDLAWLSTSLSQLGKFFVTACFNTFYLYTGELFPTVVRSAGLGSCSTVSRIGSILAPFVREMGRATNASVPYVLYSVLSISGGLLALRLPETLGKRLPDTLEESEMGKLNRHPMESSEAPTMGNHRTGFTPSAEIELNLEKSGSNRQI